MQQLIFICIFAIVLSACSSSSGGSSSSGSSGSSTSSSSSTSTSSGGGTKPTPDNMLCTEGVEQSLTLSGSAASVLNSTLELSYTGVYSDDDDQPVFLASNQPGAFDQARVDIGNLPNDTVTPEIPDSITLQVNNNGVAVTHVQSELNTVFYIKECENPLDSAEANCEGLAYDNSNQTITFDSLELTTNGSTDNLVLTGSLTWDEIDEPSAQLPFCLLPLAIEDVSGQVWNSTSYLDDETFDEAYQFYTDSTFVLYDYLNDPASQLFNGFQMDCYTKTELELVSSPNPGVYIYFSNTDLFEIEFTLASTGYSKIFRSPLAEDTQLVASDKTVEELNICNLPAP